MQYYRAQDITWPIVKRFKRSICLCRKSITRIDKMYLHFTLSCSLCDTYWIYIHSRTRFYG